MVGHQSGVYKIKFLLKPCRGGSYQRCKSLVVSPVDSVIPMDSQLEMEGDGDSENRGRGVIEVA